MVERPCDRCRQKGIMDQCREGIRKVAKYLVADGSVSGSNNGSGSSSLDEELLAYYSSRSSANSSPLSVVTTDDTVSRERVNGEQMLGLASSSIQGPPRKFLGTTKTDLSQELPASNPVSPENAMTELSKISPSSLETLSSEEQSDTGSSSVNSLNTPFERYSDHESSFLSKRKISHHYSQVQQRQQQPFSKDATEHDDDKIAPPPLSAIFDTVTQPWNYRQSHQNLIDYGESM